MTYEERVLTRRLAEGWLQGTREADLLRVLLSRSPAHRRRAGAVRRCEICRRQWVPEASDETCPYCELAACRNES